MEGKETTEKEQEELEQPYEQYNNKMARAKEMKRSEKTKNPPESRMMWHYLYNYAVPSGLSSTAFSLAGSEKWVSKATGSIPLILHSSWIRS